MSKTSSKTGQLKVSEILNCPIFIPVKLPTDMVPMISGYQMSAISGLVEFEHYFSHYFFKFIAGDKNTVSGFADIAIDELYLWDKVKVGKNSFVKTVSNTVGRFDRRLRNLINLPELTIENLIDSNTALRPKMHNYGIRKNGMKAGNPNTNPYAFYCMPPELVQEYLGDLIGFINSDVEKDVNKALMVFQQFIFIHPFRDGNGRMSRLLLLKIMQEKYGLIYSCLLSIYLKNINRDNYHIAVNQYQNNDIDALKTFHAKAIEWTNQSTKLLSDFIEEYSNKVGQFNIDSDKNYSQVVIKTDVNQKIDEGFFRFHSKKTGKNIYINTALLNVLNQFDYYLRYELRKHQNN